MTGFVIIGAVIAIGVIGLFLRMVWNTHTPPEDERPGPRNGWRNADHLRFDDKGRPRSATSTGGMFNPGATESHD